MPFEFCQFSFLFCFFVFIVVSAHFGFQLLKMSIKTIILAFSLLFLSLLVSRLHLVGLFRTDIPSPGNTFVLNGYGPCEEKSGPIGGEDIAYYEAQSLIFISSADRRTMVQRY